MMKTKNYLMKLFMLFCMMTVTAFAACSNDDDDERDNDNEAPSELIFSKTPKTGWNGNLQNGVATYVPINDDYDDDDDIQPYFAFNFSNGICQDAVFSLICPNETIAEFMASKFQDGTWITMDDDDDDDDYYGARATRAAHKMQAHAKAMTRADYNYNFTDLKLPVKRSGKVLYITIDCLKGKRGSDLQNIVIFWVTGETNVDKEILIGKWDDNAGRYTNSNLYGMGITYEINTAFENDSLTNYVTTMTFPNRTWANMIFEQLEEQNKKIEEIVKLKPEATLSDDERTVEEKAVILGKVTKKETLEIIAMLDWAMAQPFFVSMFAGY